jgi:hypothetical protein
MLVGTRVLVTLAFLVLPGSIAGACTLNSSRYQLTSDNVQWVLKVKRRELCVHGVRFSNVRFDALKIVSLPQAGHLTVQGSGFSYQTAPDFQGQDSFTLLVSGAINQVTGSSTIRVSVSVGVEYPVEVQPRRDSAAVANPPYPLCGALRRCPALC